MLDAEPISSGVAEGVPQRRLGGVFHRRVERPSWTSLVRLIDQVLQNRKISAHTGVMRRKPGAVLPLEAAILAAAIDLAAAGTNRFHGFMLAKQLRDADGAKLLTAHGTLYKALSRMETAGLLASNWEDPNAAAADGRPRRRLYEITAAGRTALAEVARQTDGVVGLDPGWSPS